MAKKNGTTTSRPAGARDREAYRGHYLIHNPFTDSWYISRDGAHISGVRSLDEACAIVDSLTEA